MLPPLQPHPISTMESYNIAIIGANSVGKSTFVRRALDLPRPPVTNSSSVRLMVDHVAHMVTLVELDLEHFQVDPSQPIQWPKQINGQIVPRVDAALILYDVLSKESIRPLPQTVGMDALLRGLFRRRIGKLNCVSMLAALTSTELPAVLGACKCDRPEDEWELNPDELAKHALFKSCVGQFKISADKSDVYRACLQSVIRAAIMHRRGELLFQTVFGRGVFRNPSLTTRHQKTSKAKLSREGERSRRLISTLPLPLMDGRSASTANTAVPAPTFPSCE